MFNLMMFDLEILFSLLESIAWIVLVGLALLILIAKVSPKEKLKKLVIVIFLVWALVSTLAAGFTTANYITNQRRTYQSIINSQ